MAFLIPVTKKIWQYYISHTHTHTHTHKLQFILRRVPVMLHMKRVDVRHTCVCLGNDWK